MWVPFKCEKSFFGVDYYLGTRFGPGSCVFECYLQLSSGFSFSSPVLLSLVVLPLLELSEFTSCFYLFHSYSLAICYLVYLFTLLYLFCFVQSRYLFCCYLLLLAFDWPAGLSLHILIHFTFFMLSVFDRLFFLLSSCTM